MSLIFSCQAEPLDQTRPRHRPDKVWRRLHRLLPQPGRVEALCRAWMFQPRGSDFSSLWLRRLELWSTSTQMARFF